MCSFGNFIKTNWTEEVDRSLMLFMSAGLSYPWAPKPAGPLDRNVSIIRTLASSAELSVKRAAAVLLIFLNLSTV